MNYEGLKTTLRHEISLANAFSLSRILLTILAASQMMKHPKRAAAIQAAAFLTDVVDGKIARHNGSSKYGGVIDIYCDHISEIITVFAHAYGLNAIPQIYPWIILSRIIATDTVTTLNTFTDKRSPTKTHPYQDFGSAPNRGSRALYGSIKTVEAIITPVIPKLGGVLSTAHIVMSLQRGKQVLLNPHTRKLIGQVLRRN